MKSDYVAQLEELSNKIKLHPLLDLLSLQIGDPVTPKTLNEVEQRLHTPLPIAVMNFYRQANGLNLKWRFKPDLPESTKDRIRSEFRSLEAPPDSLFDVAGNIQILSIEDTLLNEEYALPTDEVEDEFIFDGTKYTDNEFSRLLRPFDIIDDFFCMAFVVVPKSEEWKLMLLADYWIDFYYSRTTLLDDYFLFITTTWGIRMARHKLFSEYRGDLKPSMLFDANIAMAIVPEILKI